MKKDLVKVAYAPEQIKTFTAMPKDFDKFWQTALKEARKVPFEAEYKDIADASNDQFVTRLVRLRVGKNKWMQGYLTMPRTSHLAPRSAKYPVVLCPPGAGSQKIYPSDYFPKEGCIYMKIEIHDNDQLLDDEAYSVERQKSDGYMRRGMLSKDTYYYKDVYVGCARVLDFLCTLPEWDGKNAIVTGGSQGGALTIVTSTRRPHAAPRSIPPSATSPDSSTSGLAAGRNFSVASIRTVRWRFLPTRLWRPCNTSML